MAEAGAPLRSVIKSTRVGLVFGKDVGDEAVERVQLLVAAVGAQVEQTPRGTTVWLPRA